MLKTRILTAIVLMVLLLVVLFWLPKGAAIGFFAALVLRLGLGSHRPLG